MAAPADLPKMQCRSTQIMRELSLIIQQTDSSADLAYKSPAFHSEAGLPTADT